LENNFAAEYLKSCALADPNMGDVVQQEHPPKLEWNKGERELNYRGYMWADLVFI